MHAYLESLDTVVDADDSSLGYRFAIVSGEGLPDCVEFVLHEAPPEFWARFHISGAITISLDLTALYEHVECTAVKLGGGLSRYTFTISATDPALSSAVSVSQDDGDSRRG